MENQQQSELSNSKQPIDAKKPITFWKFFVNFLYNTTTVYLYIGVPFMIGGLIIVFTKHYDAFASVQEEGIILGAFNSLTGVIAYTLISLVATVLIVVGIFYYTNKDYQINKENYKKVIGFLAIIEIVRLILGGFDMLGLVLALTSIGLFYWLMDAKFIKNKIILENKFLTLKRGLMFVALSFAVGILMMIMY